MILLLQRHQLLLALFPRNYYFDVKYSTLRRFLSFSIAVDSVELVIKKLKCLRLLGNDEDPEDCCGLQSRTARRGLGGCLRGPATYLARRPT